MDSGAPDELVLHYKGVNRMLGSPQRMNAAIVVSAGVAIVVLASALLIHNSGLDFAAVWIGGFAALAAVLFVYGRLRFAYAGLFFSAGRVGVMGTLGGRQGVDASQVDHFQLCTLVPTSGRAYGVILFVDRSGTSLLRLNVVELIPPDGLQELSRRSRIPIHGSLDDRLSPVEMTRRFPRSVSRVVSVSDSISDHRTRTTLIVFIATVAVGIALFAALSLSSRH